MSTEEETDGKSIHLAFLKKTFDKNHSFWPHILKVFDEVTDRHINQLVGVVKKGNLKDVSPLTHKLKSACGNFRAWPMISLLTDIKNAAKENDSVKTKYLLDSIVAEHKTIKDCLIKELDL